MNIAFVLDRVSYLEKFSIPIVSSIAKQAGYNVIIVEYLQNTEKARAELVSFKPDIIGYSVSSIEAKTYLEINNTLKKHLRFFSLFGGPHPTFFPEFIKEKGVDGICRGEADLVLPIFLQRYGSKDMYTVENFSFKRKHTIMTNPVARLVDNLDSLPFPDRDSIYDKSDILARMPMKAFFAGRGCPFHCTYCFNHIFNAMYSGKGRVLRTKSVKYLISEIMHVQEKYPMTFIKFHDDVFGMDRHWLEEFAETYPREIGLPYLCYTRANIVNDAYIRLLKKSGCKSVSLAIECGNETIRNTILERNMSDEQIIRGCRSIRKHKLKLYTLNMLGLPGETVEDMKRTIIINRKIKADFADASIFQPYPGTKLTKYCIEQGYLDKEEDRYESQFSKSILKYSTDFKDIIFVLHKAFTILVDFPIVERYLPILFRCGRYQVVKYIYNLIYRLYYGYFLHHRVYGFDIPLALRMKIAASVIFSKNRA